MSSATTVVHCKRTPYDIYIGRPSRAIGLNQWDSAVSWGNPFHIGRDGTRAEVIERYREWLSTQPKLLAAIPGLRGKTLGCWCRPPEGFQGRLLCHGQILAGLADGVAPESVE